MQVLGALVAAWMLTWVVLRRARALQLIDLPNERSSHSLPTPRGGGLAIVIVCTALLLYHALAGPGSATVPLAIAAGGVVIAVVGFIDDRRGLSASLRFGVQALVALGVILALGGVPDEVASALPALAGPLGTALCVVVVLWFLNLFNFMDGIDGIAAAQSIYMTGAAAFLGALAGSAPASQALLVGVAAASAGFLAWNWAPARIFMGDVGSAFLGYLLPVMALWISTDSAVGAWTFIVLGSLFIGDASATLARRSLQGHRWSDAHRSHVYQRLSRRWSSHAKVTAAYTLANLVVVLPLAWVTLRYPQLAAPTAMGTTVISIAVFWLLGAGRPDDL